jgi:hypothetical protein
MQLVRAISCTCLTCLGLTACSGSAGEGATPARVPTRAGDLLEVATPDDRTTAPGAVLAFVNGLHVVVVDGREAYAGQTRMGGTEGDGGLVLPLEGDLSATLARSGDGYQLTFSTGEAVPMRRRAP